MAIIKKKVKYIIKRLMQHTLGPDKLLVKLTDQRKIALTFDDGPNPIYTDKFLRILSQENIEATFFLVGERAAKHPEIVKRIVQAGHSIGNHSYSHVPLKQLGLKNIKKELELANKALFNIIGKNIKTYRPPRGHINAEVIVAGLIKKLTMVLWNLSALDSGGIPKEDVIKNLNLDKIEGGTIILLHDNNDGTLNALPTIIDTLRNRKFEFVRIDKISSN